MIAHAWRKAADPFAELERGVFPSSVTGASHRGIRIGTGTGTYLDAASARLRRRAGDN